MPRPGPRRPALVFRDKQEVLDELAVAAAENGETRADYMRRIVDFGRRHMPKNYQPPPK